ncbi:MAG: integrase, partial [Candidatus Pacearchaeota archaeon]|nr:integrase [Candidatus Pacearchaeota archaeon]
MIKKKNGRWLVDIQPGGRNSKRHQRLFDTKKEAQQYERFVTTQHEQGKPWKPNHKIATPKEIFDHWYQARGMALRDGKRRYEKLKQLITVTRTKEVFYKYRQSRLESGIQPTSLNRELSYIRAAYRLAVTDGIITSNPFHNIKALPELQRELSYLTIDQIKILLAEVDKSGNKDLRLVTKLALATGARWS